MLVFRTVERIKEDRRYFTRFTLKKSPPLRKRMRNPDIPTKTLFSFLCCIYLRLRKIAVPVNTVILVNS